MVELTFEQFCKLRFDCIKEFTFDTCARRICRNDRRGIQIEVYTNRNKRTGVWGKEKRYWYVDSVSGTFETIDQCYVAYMEKVCGVKA